MVPVPAVPERDQIVLAAGHEQVHRRVPPDILDVPSVVSKDPFFSTLCERPNSRGRVVTDWESFSSSGEKLSTYGFSKCIMTLCSEAFHVGWEISDDPGLVCRRDVCTSANSDIMHLDPREKFPS